jgi:hypothetical protein
MSCKLLINGRVEKRVDIGEVAELEQGSKSMQLLRLSKHQLVSIDSWKKFLAKYPKEKICCINPLLSPSHVPTTFSSTLLMLSFHIV